MGLARRDKQPEIIDQPDLDPAVLAKELRGLRLVNVLSRSAGILWKPIRRELREQRHRAGAGGETERPLRFLDLATGGGDVPIRLWRKAHRPAARAAAGEQTVVRASRPSRPAKKLFSRDREAVARGASVPLEVAGCDCNAHCVEHAAREARRVGADVRFFQHDVLADGVPEGYDIVACSLFLHHVDDDQVVPFLRNMRQAARRMALVNDLTRSRGGLVLSYVGPRLVSRSRIMHIDAPRSVRAAFTVAEVRELAAKAGWDGATVTRHWPYRFLLEWKRGAE